MGDSSLVPLPCLVMKFSSLQLLLPTAEYTESIKSRALSSRARSSFLDHLIADHKHRLFETEALVDCEEELRYEQ